MTDACEKRFPSLAVGKNVQKETHVCGSFTVILETVDSVNDDLINLGGECRVHVRGDTDVRVRRRIA